MVHFRSISIAVIFVANVMVLLGIAALALGIALAIINHALAPRGLNVCSGSKRAR